MILCIPVIIIWKIILMKNWLIIIPKVPVYDSY